MGWNNSSYGSPAPKPAPSFTCRTRPSSSWKASSSRQRMWDGLETLSRVGKSDANIVDIRIKNPQKIVELH